ncbi:MAG: fumarate hydratase [Candidatus Cloacimonetes bacterium]|nr:fumarate hydratase [Candidatus Cloacimonadota bacterium]
MRVVDRITFKQAIKDICSSAHYELDTGLVKLLENSYKDEVSIIARDILQTIIENAQLAKVNSQPLCQDTGIGMFFIEMGEEILVEGGSATKLINEAFREIYQEESFRKSVVREPLFARSNTGDNLPPIIHWDFVPGDRIKVYFLPKGAGAENMSRLKMFHPLSDKNQLIEFVLDTVRRGGGNPCPPLLIGIGIGGSFDYVPILAKKALLRPIMEDNPDSRLTELEAEILTAVNNLGIGPMGLGGKTTALRVTIIQYPCHTASLPVAINLQCHSHRCKMIII